MVTTFGYGARVPVSPDNDPDSQGGPFRRSPFALVPSGDGMPPEGNPQMVYRTPHAVVPDAEPGAGWPGDSLWSMKFLPDGRLVPAAALGAAATDTQRAVSGLVRFGAIGGLAFGLLSGAIYARQGRRLRGAAVGSLVGLSAGLFAAGIATGGALVAAEVLSSKAA